MSGFQLSVAPSCSLEHVFGMQWRSELRVQQAKRAHSACKCHPVASVLLSGFLERDPQKCQFPKNAL